MNGYSCYCLTVGAEINAASSVMALTLSTKFDLTTTYFLVAGIAGVNPEVATICSVTFARYAVSVGLQCRSRHLLTQSGRLTSILDEFSQFEIPTNFTSGYIPLGAKTPQQYPLSIYGTEVIEFNKNLQIWAATQARKAKLMDSKDAKAYRANYASNPAYAPGAASPAVYECDVATSDQYYSGTILSEAMGNFTSLVTNGTGNYCTTAQEDNATGEALVRAALEKLVDFNRIIVMRTASDFDRPWPGEAATTNLFWAEQGAFVPAIANIYSAGIEVVKGIVNNWDNQFAAGMNASNYVGDIFGTLGGTPDFGPYVSNNSEYTAQDMRSWVC